MFDNPKDNLLQLEHQLKELETAEQPQDIFTDENEDADFFDKHDVHIHAPEGAVPKDGPSAGVTITTALVSELTGRTVKQSVAMTGEISLRGRVLQIGGLKEKSMAAYRAGIKTIIIPYDNISDLDEVDPKVKETVTFEPVKTVEAVWDIALEKEEKPAKKSKSKDDEYDDDEEEEKPSKKSSKVQL